MAAQASPRLPSGLVAFVKRECPTCQLVAPVLARLAGETDLTVFTQDDPTFPSGTRIVDDGAGSASGRSAPPPPPLVPG